VRFKTREVMVGSIGVGAHHPIRIQSMTTSDTRDVSATADQIMRLADAGCEIARVTVQGKKEADSCEGIKDIIVKKGYTIPIVADIHFYPPAAMRVVDFVEKVRVNPGNYVDRRASFKQIEYDDQTYADEIKRIEEGFSPLVEKCLLLKRAMRIGVNHGSLSDRIMSRYGDTPFGMVESALEFARVCRSLNYHNFVFSMKASNTLVMIQAYRLLVEEMKKLGWDYPLHLGVTEAGDGEDGRVKSAIGIGSLLLDGIGDTIRVSLTEDPWEEIDPCKRLKKLAESYERLSHLRSAGYSLEIKKRAVIVDKFLPLHRDGSVYVFAKEEEILEENFYQDIGCVLEFGKPKRTQGSVDALVIEQSLCDPKALEKISLLEKQGISRISLKSFVDADKKETWQGAISKTASLIILRFKSSQMHLARAFFHFLEEKKVATPVILSFHDESSFEDLIIKAAAEAGALLADGFGEGLCIEGPYTIKQKVGLAFNILQGCRKRSSKTEYIACPGCGRTLFGLQEVTKKIREKTAHLPGVKIAVMGCIVNGPGEMADADFGYVGSRPGKIDLYVGKICVEKNIDTEMACERLVELIKSHGRWIEPSLV
jgi:(E)-4-hydroxy-3-methylbut-2-enyl-diphosphate synthase